MKISKHRFLVYIIMCMLSAAILYAKKKPAVPQIPDWFLSPYSIEGYSAENYIIGVGSASDLNEAKNLAIADIQKQIEVKIEGAQLTITRSEQKEGKEKYEEDIVRKSRAYVKGRLKNISFLKTAEIGGVYYVAAALDKRKFLQELKSEIDGIYNRVTLLVGDAEDALYTKRNIDRYINKLQKAYNLIKKIQYKLQLYNTLSTSKYLEKVQISRLLKDINWAKNAIQIDVLSGAKQSIEANHKSFEKVIAHLFVVDDYGEKINLRNAEARVYYENQKELGTFYTDDSGRVEFYYYAFPLVKDKESFFIYIVPVVNGAELSSAKAVLKYRVMQPNVNYKIQLQFNASDPSISKVKDKIMDAINTLGYLMGPSSYLLSVEANLNEMAGIRGFSGDFRNYKLNISVGLYKEGEKIAQESFDFNVFSLGGGELDLSRVDFLKTRLPELIASALYEN